MSDYQLAVIGAGPGGYNAAMKASQLGIKTVLIEKGKTLGGTCLNIGCIPSKALLSSSEHYHFATHRFSAHGIRVDNLSVDVPTMMQRKGEVVSKLAQGVEFLMKKNKVDVIYGSASLLSGESIKIQSESGERTITAERILIATGSTPIELPFMPFDGEKIVSSDHALSFASVPKSLLIIGAGAIGLELGSVWARLGTDVTVLEFLPRIAAGFDSDASKQLQRSLEKLGLTFHLQTQVQSAEVLPHGVKLTAKQGEATVSFEAEKVLVCVGRKPHTKDLGLEQAGVKLTDKGRIQTDAHWQTSVPTVFAIGDVTEGPMLAHKAEEEAVAVAEYLAGKAGHVNYALIPNVVYTSPEVASVGLTEEQAKEKQIPYKVGKFPFTANGRALASDSADGMVKIIAHAQTDRLLGAHIVASNASELIAECVSVMEFGGSAEDIARTVHAHPTMSEAIKGAAGSLT